MKNLIVIVSILLLGCSNSNSENSESEQKKIKKTCEHHVPLGNIDICLPIVDGMTECYSNPKAKSQIDSFVDKGSIQLAFYLNNETFKHIDKLSETKIDDYFSIQCPIVLKNKSVGTKELNELADQMEGGYIKENWASVKNKIEKNYDWVTMGRPVIIETHKPKNTIRTLVILMKSIIQENEKVSIVIMNLVLIKNRIVLIAYYKDYYGEASVISAKTKSDYTSLLFDEENSE